MENQIKLIKRGEYKYSEKDLLGKGSFGEVYKCYSTKTDKKYALKIISAEKLKKLGDYGQELLNRELKTHKEASQSGIPFFVKLEDSFLRNKDMILILEFCDSDLLRVLKKPIPENIVTRLIMQIGIGLFYLHSMGIIHRDIKPDNIFVKNGIIKIGDFGFATKDVSPSTELGTLPYKAPELFGKNTYDTKVDVWSLNTVFYKFLTKKFFFSTRSNAVYINEVRHKKFVVNGKYKISPVIRDLLEKGYIKDRFERPNILEYLNHKAFDPIRKDYEIFFTKLPKTIKTDQQNMDRKVDDLSIYVNNILKYSDLARNLIKKGNNDLISFFLVKKGLQKLSIFFMFWKNNIRPNFINIPQNEWEQLVKDKLFNTLMMKCKKNIKIMSKEYSNFLNDFKNTYRGDKNSTFKDNLKTMEDLNLDIDRDCFNHFFKESYTNEKKMNPNSELLFVFKEVLKYEQNPKTLFK